MQPSTVNGTGLGAQEWRNALFLWYGLEPPDLPTHCNFCQAKLSISHALDCKKCGLVTARHNNLCDGVADLADKAFTPSHMRDDPLIYSGRTVKRKKAAPAGAGGNSNNAVVQTPEVTEHNVDLLIRDLWHKISSINPTSLPTIQAIQTLNEPISARAISRKLSQNYTTP